jgi:serine/threonine protein kinase/ankyrin repeat protein
MFEEKSDWTCMEKLGSVVCCPIAPLCWWPCYCCYSCSLSGNATLSTPHYNCYDEMNPGCSRLLSSCWCGHCNTPILMMRYMLSCGACGCCFSIRGDDSNLALHVAAKSGDNCLVSFLLCCGALPYQVHQDSARSNGQIETAKLFDQDVSKQAWACWGICKSYTDAVDRPLRRNCWGYYRRDSEGAGICLVSGLFGVALMPLSHILWCLAMCTSSNFNLIQEHVQNCDNYENPTTCTYHETTRAICVCCCVEFHSPIVIARHMFCCCGRYFFPFKDEDLHEAARRRLHCLIRYMLCCGVDSTVVVGGETAAESAISKGFFDTASIISPQGKPPLYTACSTGDAAKFEKLYERGEDDEKLLSMAVSQGHTAIVKIMLSAGCSPNIQRGGVSLLTTAVQRGNMDTLKLLINDENCQISAAGSGGKTAISVAVSTSGKSECVVLLMERCLHMHRIDPAHNDSKLMMKWAVENNKPEYVAALLTQGVSPRFNTDDGSPMLHIACTGQYQAIVDLLLEHGDCGVDEVDKNKETALIVALKRRKHIDVKDNYIVEILLSKSAAVPQCMYKDYNCISKDDWSRLVLLMHHGFRLLAFNTKNKTTLDLLREEKLLDDFYDTVDIPYAALSANNCELWFHMIQIEGGPSFSNRICNYAKNYAALVTAKDTLGRPAEEVATPANKRAINRAYLWFEKYRPLDKRPEHISKTCEVYRAVDVENLDETGEPRRVAVKLMRVRSQWRREIAARQLNISGNDLIELSATYPEDENSCDLPEEIEAEHDGHNVSSAMRSNEDVKKMYCLVMPLADRNLYVAIKQEGWAGQKYSECMHTFEAIVTAVQGVHKAGYLHADLKTLNIVRRAMQWVLIDMDACCRIGQDPVGFKSSTSVMPPEAIFGDSSSGVICTRSEVSRSKLNIQFDLLLADPSFDVWSLGCILYNLASEEARPLMQGGQDDNLSIDPQDPDNLWELLHWTDAYKARKLAKVKDPGARNLLSLMLHKDAKRRPTLGRILAHPCVSGKQVVRLPGAEPEFDVFLSYRVASDQNSAESLYTALTSIGIRVWWDKVCLKPGEPWEEGFCSGLVNSRTFVCLLSREAINHPDRAYHQNFGQLDVSSKCDNVLLEHRMALELRDFGYIENIHPVFIGDFNVSSDQFQRFDFGLGMPKAPDVHVDSVEAKLIHHLDSQGMGYPLRTNRTVAEVMKDLLACQGAFVSGPVCDAWGDAIRSVHKMVLDKGAPLTLDDVEQEGSPRPSVGEKEDSNGSSGPRMFALQQQLSRMEARNSDLNRAIAEMNQRNAELKKEIESLRNAPASTNHKQLEQAVEVMIGHIEEKEVVVVAEIEPVRTRVLMSESRKVHPEL